MLTAIRPSSFPWFKYDGYTFSLGLTEGESAWLSGFSASQYDEASGHIVVVGGMTEQVELAYTKIERILEAAGLGWSDVVHVVENLTLAGVPHYQEARAVRERLFGDDAPVVTTVVVDRLLRRRALIEIEVTARRGGGERLAAAAETGWHRGGAIDADDMIHLPTLLPVDEAGGVVYPGDIVSQYRYVLERAGTILESIGLDLSHVVSTIDYSTPETRSVYGKCGRPRKELLGPVYPVAAGILMERLHAPGVLIALDVTASRTTPELVNPGWARYERLTYSPGVRAGRALFVCGFGAVDLTTEESMYPGDVVAQARQAMSYVHAVLAAAGAGPEHVVKTIEYVTPDGLDGYRGVADVRRDMLVDPWPASTGIVCHSLLREGLQVEVVATAILP